MMSKEKACWMSLEVLTWANSLVKLLLLFAMPSLELQTFKQLCRYILSSVHVSVFVKLIATYVT